MYVDPVLLGVLATLFVEMLIFTLYTVSCVCSSGGDDDHEDCL